MSGEQGETVFSTETNCWRTATADRLSLVVNGSDYFTHLRDVIKSARRELLLIGWDFDFEIEMLPGASDENGCAPDGLPNRLGAFLEAVVELSPDLQIYILKWNGAVLVAPGRVLPALALDLLASDRITLALDGHHPFGACHHQKIVVADDTFAFCGGIDVTESRWDTAEHLPEDPRRIRKDGSLSEPWHDASMALTGPVASALAELSRRRWHRATGTHLTRPEHTTPAIWPADLPVDIETVNVAIARTEPPYDGEPLVNEIEQLFLDTIRAAKHTIYIESQYLTTQTVCDALEQRLCEDGGPEIVIINPQAALSKFEDEAMHSLRGRVIDRLRAADHEDRFRIFCPVSRSEQPIYVHAKIQIVDDQVFHIGSSNLNDRSIGFDTECNVALEGKPALIRSYRTRLLAEHLDVAPERIEATLTETGSLIATIDALNSTQGSGLRPVEVLVETAREQWLADTRLMDKRYVPGQETATGKGIRPRHLVLIAGAAAMLAIGWKALRRQGRDR